jgi:hypothetical protein
MSRVRCRNVIRKNKTNKLKTYRPEEDVENLDIERKVPFIVLDRVMEDFDLGQYWMDRQIQDVEEGHLAKSRSSSNSWMAEENRQEKADVGGLTPVQPSAMSTLPAKRWEPERANQQAHRIPAKKARQATHETRDPIAPEIRREIQPSAMSSLPAEPMETERQKARSQLPQISEESKAPNTTGTNMGTEQRTAGLLNPNESGRDNTGSVLGKRTLRDPVWQGDYHCAGKKAEAPKTAAAAKEADEEESRTTEEKTTGAVSYQRKRKLRGWVPPKGETEWEVVEILDAPPQHGGGKGVFIRPGLPGLDPEAKMEYGGQKISKEEFLARMEDPENSKYLLEVGEEDGTTTYIDAHPRLLTERGENPLLWIGAYCNQANTVQERNAQISFVRTREQKTRPRRNNVDHTISICIRIIKPIAAGEQILVNYGYDVQAQMDYKLGYTYHHKVILNLPGEPEYDSNSSPDEKGKSASIPASTWQRCRRIMREEAQILETGKVTQDQVKATRKAKERKSPLKARQGIPTTPRSGGTRENNAEEEAATGAQEESNGAEIANKRRQEKE